MSESPKLQYTYSFGLTQPFVIKTISGTDFWTTHNTGAQKCSEGGDLHAQSHMSACSICVSHGACWVQVEPAHLNQDFQVLRHL